MSPEQAEGQTTDNRSDIFSLGIILYKMLTGKRPFSGHSVVALLSSIVRDTPRPVTEIRSALPHDLGRIIRRCLMKDPEQRYQSAKDLRNDLEDLKHEMEMEHSDRTGVVGGGLKPSPTWTSALRQLVHPSWRRHAKTIGLRVLLAGLAVMSYLGLR
jgi:serine/threonine protein kinase